MIPIHLCSPEQRLKHTVYEKDFEICKKKKKKKKRTKDVRK